MSDAVYERLADALNAIPNGFPRTKTGSEIRLLQKIFSPEDAEIASQLTGTSEPLDIIAERLGMSDADARSKLMAMAKRGFVWFSKKSRPPKFRLAAFIVGIWEDQNSVMDHELAHLFEQYFLDGGAEGIMKAQPALHRVVPAHAAAHREWILPYDDVKAILESAKTFAVQDCICRMQQDHVGRKCDFPLKNCLMFSMNERPAKPNDISRENALAILDESEKIGLVHCVSNVQQGLAYVCNCCGCCCSILRGITQFGIEESVAHANYYADLDVDICESCGTCIERCQVGAITEGEDTPELNRQRCIGCGLCVTECPSGAMELKPKPKDEIIEPPPDFNIWEHERAVNRGLA